MKLTEWERETLVGFVGEWLEQLGDNDTNDLVKIYNKLTKGEN
jgi:hypothetical protein